VSQTASEDRLRIALCCLHSEYARDAVDPRPANLERMLGAIRRAAEGGADLVVFGELFLTGYESGARSRSIAIDRRMVSIAVPDVVALARECEVMLIFGLATVDDAGRLYNSAAVVAPDGALGLYDKLHIPGMSLDDGRRITEDHYFTPGAALGLIETRFGPIGIEICYDAHFPELARELAARGARLIVNLSAAPVEFAEIWHVLLRARAVENGVWYAHVSIVGPQKAFTYFPGIGIVSPNGMEAGPAVADGESLLFCDIDLDRFSHMRADVRAKLRSHEIAALPAIAPIEVPS